MNIRSYSFNIVTYVTDIQAITDFCTNTFKYAFILHDQDLNKSPHYHIICSFKQNKSFDSVRKLLPAHQNTIVEKLIDKYGAFEYLTHKNNPDKFQYSSELISTNDLKYFERPLSKEFSNEQFLFDLCFSILSEYDLAVRYGRDYIIHRSQYLSFKNVILSEQLSIERGYPAYFELLTYERFLSDIHYYENQAIRDRLLEIQQKPPFNN